MKTLVWLVCAQALVLAGLTAVVVGSSGVPGGYPVFSPNPASFPATTGYPFRALCQDRAGVRGTRGTTPPTHARFYDAGMVLQIELPITQAQAVNPNSWRITTPIVIMPGLQAGPGWVSVGDSVTESRPERVSFP